MKDDCGIMFLPYLPLCRTLTQEQWLDMEKRARAGKAFAKVRLSNPSPSYRCKRGEVKAVEAYKDERRVCLRIETVNICDEKGFMTLLGTSDREDIWFGEAELHEFELYGSDGELVATGDSLAEVNLKAAAVGRPQL